MLIRCARKADFTRITEIFHGGAIGASGCHRSAHFVAQENERLVAYAAYRCRPGSDAVIENDIFLGAGADDEHSVVTLLATLVEHARVRGFRLMLARVDVDDAAAIAAHERLGFMRTGILGLTERNRTIAMALGLAGGEEAIPCHTIM